MGNRISLSQEVFGIEEVAVSHLDFDRSIRFYYSNPSTQQLDPKFVGYSPIELEQERDERLEELDKNSAFMVLTAVEARLKVDFLLRCKQRKKDSLSEHYQSIRKTKGDNISFEETILDGWKTHYPHSKALMSALRVHSIFVTGLLMVAIGCQNLGESMIFLQFMTWLMRFINFHYYPSRNRFLNGQPIMILNCCYQSTT